MAPPRVAVVGSCVSRDAFNSSFVPDYKSRVNLVGSVYQSSMPSLAREAPMLSDAPAALRQNYVDTIMREYSGRNMHELISTKPDILVMDFYADVHFGIARIKEQFVTRNHMAFTAMAAADAYYNDRGKAFPDRGRFEGQTDAEGSYSQLAKESMTRFVGHLREESPKTQIIVNAARFALKHVTRLGSEEQYENAERLSQKNKYWEDIDRLMKTTVDCESISYPEDLLVGLETHKWGANPVHYTQEYYDYFWCELEAMIYE